MTTTTSTTSTRIAGYNNLAFCCLTRIGDEYWPHYQLGHYEPGSGCALDEAFADGWEETTEEDEEIVISTPGLPIDDNYDFEHEWILLKKEDEGEVQYLEVCVTDDVEGFGKWYDAGFP